MRKIVVRLTVEEIDQILEHIDDSRHFDGKEEHDLIAKLVAAKAGAEKD
jgi:hypothetical protein